MSAGITASEPPPLSWMPTMSDVSTRPLNTLELIAIVAAALAQIAVTVMWMHDLV